MKEEFGNNKLLHPILKFDGGEIHCFDFIEKSRLEFGKPVNVFNGKNSIVIVYQDVVHGISISNSGEVVMIRSDKM